MTTKNRSLAGMLPDGNAMMLPSGNTAQRPANTAGMIRYNTSIGYCEFFNGSIWQNMGVGGVINYTVDNLTGDGATTVFNMSQSVANAQQIIFFVGSIYQIPVTNYTVNGTIDISNSFFSATPIILCEIMQVVHSKTNGC